MQVPVHEYVSTKRDFLDAQRLHRKNRPRAAAAYYAWFVAVPLLAAVYLVYFAVHWHSLADGDRAVNVGLACAAGYLLLVMPAARWWQIRKLWRVAQPEKYRGKPVTLQFDEEQIISARPGASEGRFRWTAIEDYAEDDRLALIYVQRKLFLFIPKRAMDDTEWERLRSLAAPRKEKK